MRLIFYFINILIHKQQIHYLNNLLYISLNQMTVLNSSSVFCLSRAIKARHNTTRQQYLHKGANRKLTRIKSSERKFFISFMILSMHVSISAYYLFDIYYYIRVRVTQNFALKKKVPIMISFYTFITFITSLDYR